MLKLSELISNYNALTMDVNFKGDGPIKFTETKCLFFRYLKAQNQPQRYYTVINYVLIRNLIIKPSNQ
jgi:hypothetical protein